MKKYELTDEFKIAPNGNKVFRIKALVDIPRRLVKAGDLGGFVESESNLSHVGDCWVSDSAHIYDSAYISDSAQVYGSAVVSGSASVYGSARVYGSAVVSGLASVYGLARVSGSAIVTNIPIIITNTKYNITITDNIVCWGCRNFTFDEVKKLELDDCGEMWAPNEFKLNKKIITEMIRYYRSEK